MGQGCMRRPGAKAKVCLLLAVLLGLFVAKPARAAASFMLAETESEPGVVVYPAQTPGVHRVTVLLHGMCGEPQNACSHFAEQVTGDEHLICPRASRRCDGGGSTWPQTGFEQKIEQAVLRAEAALGNTVDETHGRTLIGYSLGAYRALEIAQHGAGKYPRVMLIGARILANQKLLRANGVERLLLSAGAWDMMHDPMRRETERLVRGGFTARFLGLGAVGHAFTPSLQQHLPDALGWLKEVGATPNG
jgi:predicted esterase